MNRRYLVTLIAVLLVVLAAVLVWISSTGSSRSSSGRPGDQSATGTNPEMDIRFNYNPQVFTSEFAERSEFPLQLRADGWVLCGKRLAGLGTMLEDAPAPMIYDFAASQHSELYESYYLLEREFEEYEDATIQGRLAVHCKWRYNRTAETKDLPYYFPEAVRSGDTVESEGWALFTERDLFFFYTFSSSPLTTSQRAEVLAVLNSIQFNALGLDSDPAGRGSQAVPSPESDEQRP